MKRLIFSIGLAACLFSLPAFASDKNIPEVMSSFFQTFRNAQDVNWTEVDDMLRIGFTLNGHSQFAYYSNNELVVVAKEIKMEELPLTLKTQLAEYKGYVVSHVYELVKDNVKEYCAVLDSPSKHIALKGKKAWKRYLDERN